MNDSPRSKTRGRLWGLSLVVAALAWRSLFIVPETETALVTRFGRPVRTLTEAGPYFKWPFESRIRFDKRILLYNPRPTELLTRDKKNLVVASAVCWRIVAPQKFLQAVGDVAKAEMRLHDIVWATLSAAVGQLELSQLVSVDPDQIRVDELLDQVRVTTNRRARNDLGIEVVDVQLKRLNFPEENRPAVFARMRAERSRIAKEYRAQGEERAMEIRAEADREREVLLAEAYRQAQEIQGEGDAEAARIYGQAYSQSPEFYKFLRTLESYKKILDGKTTLILSSDSELLRLLTEGRPPG